MIIILYLPLQAAAHMAFLLSPESAPPPSALFGVETIGSHFGAGAIPQSLPAIAWPDPLT
jgi:hypothetical protein